MIRTDTLYWPIGNPYPDSDDRNRQGDNLFTDCILALNPNTAELKWHYQFTPHDVHDWNSTEPPVLVDTEYQGRLENFSYMRIGMDSSMCSTGPTARS
jgi:glucose dehydrogenase